MLSVATVIAAAVFVAFRSPAEREGGSAASIPALSETYANPDYGFSFKYPAGSIVYAMPYGDGIAITVNDKNAGKGFQITIQPFDEPMDALTAERVRKDLSDLPINNPEETTVGGEGKGISFNNDSSKHIWFIARGNLYQATSPLDSQRLLLAVMNTVSFE